jgi:MFS family permease
MKRRHARSRLIPVKQNLEPPGAERTALPPWNFVLTFGLVSLFADMVYEGARSIIGPYLGTLGASAAVVGLVAGVGEFIGYGLRVGSGYVVGRTGRYWTWTIAGYALTVLSVPAIGLVGALVPAALLYGTERLGKAVRSPAKDTLLSFASTQTGRGTAFGVHQALDQTGALLGPLLLAAVLSWREGDYRLAFGVLIVPGIAVLAMLFWIRTRVPDPRDFEPAGAVERNPGAQAAALRQPLPRLFWQYVGAVAVLSCGVASFPLLAFHATSENLLPDDQIPLLFALAMAVDGLTGPVVGRIYDRRGAVVLLAVPIAAAAAAIAFTDSTLWLWVGVGVWGIVNGVLDSVIKATVTELVEPLRRAAAFGWLALVRGVGLLVAGVALGAAYDVSPGLAILLILVANAIALAGLTLVLRRMPRRGSPAVS